MRVESAWQLPSLRAAVTSHFSLPTWHSEGGSNSVVESQPSKLLVAGSIPVSRSIRLRSRLSARYGEMSRRSREAAKADSTPTDCDGVLRLDGLCAE